MTVIAYNDYWTYARTENQRLSYDGQIYDANRRLSDEPVECYRILYAICIYYVCIYYL